MLAAGQGFHDAGWQVAFAMATDSVLRERVTEEGFPICDIGGVPGSNEDADETSRAAASVHAGWIAVDGYHFGPPYQAALKKSGFSVFFLDDYGHGAPYTADLVLNQNADASDVLYRDKSPWTRLLLGPRYALLRREFRARARRERSTPERARRILVTLGGSDPGNATELVLRALALLPETTGLSATVAVGAANPRGGEIATLARQCPFPVTVLTGADMPRLMQDADLAVAGGGTTCYELAFMGLPAIVLAIAGNQESSAAALHEAGVCRFLGAASTVAPGHIRDALANLAADPGERRAMSERGRSLVDGDGVDRVALALSGDRLRLRPVRAEDCRLLFTWANDPVTRQASFTSNPIPWEDHQRWFKEKKKDPRHVLLLALDAEDNALGHVRFERDGADAVLSITVAPEARGKGIGTEIVTLAVERLFRTTDARTVHAYVKPENHASAKLFQKAGFREAGMENIKGRDALRFAVERATMGIP
jgi:spore coat polysaccharide biosynthesis predicted glycosyltransferase SpsG/L-amino acid N-acyltransferase YncA